MALPRLGVRARREPRWVAVGLKRPTGPSSATTDADTRGCLSVRAGNAKIILPNVARRLEHEFSGGTAPKALSKALSGRWGESSKALSGRWGESGVSTPRWRNSLKSPQRPEIPCSLKTVALLRKLRHRGQAIIEWIFTFALSAYNLVRIRNLTAAAT